MFGPRFERGKIGRDQRGNELVLVPDHRTLRHHHRALELVFDRLRSNELATGGLEQFLLAIGDVEKSIIVETANVASSEIAFAIETLFVGTGPLPVTDEDGWTAHE